jgi:hypothetical protein
MKKIALFLIMSLAFFRANSQCDNPYYKVKEGTVIVMESFDKKDKMQTRTETKITAYEPTGNGFIATVTSSITDKKDKLVSEGDYKMTCEDNIIKIDMSGFVPAESVTAFQNMEVEVTMDQLEYPANLSAGQELDDASIEISTSNNPIPMKLTFDISNRKVEGNETVTTPAGTYDCLKISYNTHSKMMIANMNFTNVEYLSKVAGAVRTETYKSNGNLMSYTLLTKYEY